MKRKKPEPATAGQMTVKPAMSADTVRHQFFAVDEHYFHTVIVPRERDRAGGMPWDEPERRDDLYSRDGNDAHIAIDGELDPHEYGLIVEAVARAEADPMASRIIFDINSPGGTVEGVAQAAAAIRDATKPTEARVYYLAASAAYWLATQTDSIKAEVGTVMVGSIGVIVAFWDFTKAMEEYGIKFVVITSSKSPKKYSDPTTEQGRSDIVERLDDIYAEFAGAVASGRGVPVETVESDYGKGAVLIAGKAKAQGMIDGIMTTMEGKQAMSEPKDKDTKVYSQAEFDAAMQAATEKVRADCAKHLAYIGRVHDDKAIVANIVAGKSYIDCVEGYAENAANKQIAAATIADNPAGQTAAPKGRTPADAADKKDAENKEAEKLIGEWYPGINEPNNNGK